jgi:hypothetical protein
VGASAAAEPAARDRLGIGLGPGRDDYIRRLVGRPTRFEHNQYLGDKRTQVVYDLDLADSDPEVAAAIDDLMASERFAAFGPDTLAEARNRGYRPHKSIKRALATEEA